MSGKIRTYCVLTLLAISTPYQAAFAGCLTTRQIEADQLKFVQASLTAAGQYCRGNRRDQILKIYNTFIGRYRSELMVGLEDLSLYYQLEEGEGHRAALDNHISMQTSYVLEVGRETSDFCTKLLESTTWLMQKDAIEPIEWLNVLPVDYQPVVGRCELQSYQQMASSK